MEFSQLIAVEFGMVELFVRLKLILLAEIIQISTAQYPALEHLKVTIYQQSMELYMEMEASLAQKIRLAILLLKV